MWLGLLFGMGGGDTGDEEYCETSRPGGVRRDRVCVFERVEDFCSTGECRPLSEWLDGRAEERGAWLCAEGSDFSAIIQTFTMGGRELTSWYDQGGELVALAGDARVCCENIVLQYVEVAYPGADGLGRCYAPVLAQFEQDLDPTSQTCEPTPEGKGCATAPSAPLWPGLLALLLLRVRR